MTRIIRRRKSRKERVLAAASDAAKKVTEIRLAWAGSKTAVKVAVPAVAVGAVAAVAKKRSGGGQPPQQPVAA